MKLSIRALSPLAIAASALVLTACSAAAPEEAPEGASAGSESDLATQILSVDKADIENADWGRFLTYSGGTTFGTKGSLTGVAEIKPGREIHPPHVHAEEEYLMIIEGNGTWYLNGEEMPAKTGDMLYSKPWDRHGLRNTGETMLKFVVWKWNSKGVPVMPQPESQKEDKTAQ